MLALLSYNKIKMFDLIKKTLYSFKNKQHITHGYASNLECVNTFGHPSSGGPLTMPTVNKKREI
jgi:hypothetical protein